MSMMFQQFKTEGQQDVRILESLTYQRQYHGYSVNTAQRLPQDDRLLASLYHWLMLVNKPSINLSTVQLSTTDFEACFYKMKGRHNWRPATSYLRKRQVSYGAARWGKTAKRPCGIWVPWVLKNIRFWDLKIKPICCLKMPGYIHI